MRNKIGELSRVEWELMKICWKRGKSSAKDIYDESRKEKKRAYQTIKTILDRLVEKGFLDREKFGPIWLYSPVVSKASLTSNAIEDFLKTVLDNTITPIFLHVAKKEKYRNEIEKLKRLIDELPNNGEKIS